MNNELEGGGIVLFSTSIGNIEGKILTIVEAFGMKETQEKSAKDLIRNAIWSVIKDEAVWIGPKTHKSIRIAEEKHRETTFNGDSVEIVE